MTVLNFTDYRIDSLNYERNDDYDDSMVGQKLDYQPKFELVTQINSELKEATLQLSYETPSDFPFSVQVAISGRFRYETQEDTASYGFEYLLKTNGSAILFPYLRATVSQVTGMSNEFSAFVLPTVNLTAYFNQSSQDTQK